METPFTGFGVISFMGIQVIIVVDVHSPTNGVQFFADHRNSKVVACGGYRGKGFPAIRFRIVNFMGRGIDQIEQYTVRPPTKWIFPSTTPAACPPRAVGMGVLTVQR